MTQSDQEKREAKIEELKAHFRAGTLEVDSSALAASLVQAHISRERDPEIEKLKKVAGSNS